MAVVGLPVWTPGVWADTVWAAGVWADESTPVTPDGGVVFVVMNGVVTAPVRQVSGTLPFWMVQNGTWVVPPIPVRPRSFTKGLR